MHRTPRALGAEGEDRAARLLANSGYRIVGRNLRCDGVELDLIARRGRLVAIVEVKTRRSRRCGLPEEALDERKCRRLIRGARAWLRENGRRVDRVRFDVVVCEVDGEDWTLRHIEAAFDASP